MERILRLFFFFFLIIHRARIGKFSFLFSKGIFSKNFWIDKGVIKKGGRKRRRSWLKVRGNVDHSSVISYRAICADASFNDKYYPIVSHMIGTWTGLCISSFESHWTIFDQAAVHRESSFAADTVSLVACIVVCCVISRLPFHRLERKFLSNTLLGISPFSRHFFASLPKNNRIEQLQLQLTMQKTRQVRWNGDERGREMNVSENCSHVYR